MNIDFSVDSLSTQLSGIGRYTLQLLHGLQRHADIERLRTFYHDLRLDNPYRLLTESAYSLRRQAVYRHILRRYLENLVPARRVIHHGPNFMLPRGISEGIITVHDLSVFKFPETHPPERIAHFERDFAHSLDRAVHIITDTETGRRELLEFAGLPPDRVTAVHLGVSSA